MAETRYEALQEELRASPKRWLVTGAAGFIGSHLVEELLRLGQSVTGLDNFSSGSRKNLELALAEAGKGAAARFHLIEGDIRDEKLCREACEGAEAILHQAALVSVPRSWDEPLDTYRVNVGGFVSVLAGALRARVSSVVYASSCAVYGDPKTVPSTEEDVAAPLSPYAASKRMDELAAGLWDRDGAIQITGLRYFNVFGPRQDPAGGYAAVIPRWSQQLSEGRSPVVFGTGENTRDFCSVTDVVQANLLAARPLGGSVARLFNVGLGRQTSLLDLFARLRDGLAARGAPCGAIGPVFDAARRGDIRHSGADLTRVRRELGFEPLLGLEEALGQTMDWFLGERAGG